jgi:glucose-specific phosphotransferase system IIA component
MFKGFFKKDDSFIQVPLEGDLVPIENVPDEVFSKKLMGDGFAIQPTNTTVVSPVDGEVVSVFPTRHAVGLKDRSGHEVLIHVGLDTVNLNGEGFASFVKDGQKVKKGQKLLEVDFDSIKGKVPSILTVVIFTNLKEGERILVDERGVRIG